MIGWILLTVYIVGIPCWIWFEKKFMPYKDGDYTIEFDGIYEITPDMWKGEVCARAVLWPLCIGVCIVLIPFLIIEELFDKL